VAIKPILLRPDEELAAAMEQIAMNEGVSRQAWMLDVLDQAVQAIGYCVAVSDDDVPLPGT
jgi:hypothetical protein